MGTVRINGKTFEGDNIEVRGDSVYVDGKEVMTRCTSPLHVNVEGMIRSLKADGSVTCDGVAGNVAAGGSVTCDNVGGNVAAGGSVTCGKVEGHVHAGGNVRVG